MDFLTIVLFVGAVLMALGGWVLFGFIRYRNYFMQVRKALVITGTEDIWALPPDRLADVDDVIRRCYFGKEPQSVAASRVVELLRVKQPNRNEQPKARHIEEPQAGYRIPAASRAMVLVFLRQRDIALAVPGNDTDVYDIAAVAGVLVDRGIETYRGCGEKVPLGLSEFKILTVMAIAVATGVSLAVSEDAPWERIAVLVNMRLSIRHGSSTEYAAIAGRAPQTYNTYREDPRMLRHLEALSQGSMIALRGNDLGVAEKVAGLLAVGLKVAKETLR